MSRAMISSRRPRTRGSPARSTWPTLGRCHIQQSRSAAVPLRVATAGPPASDMAPPEATTARSGSSSALPIPAAYPRIRTYVLHLCLSAVGLGNVAERPPSRRGGLPEDLSLIHISEPTRQAEISYAVF